MPPPRVTICSYRLGGTDGVAVEAEKWRRALLELGCSVTTVAGEGRADRLVSGLAASAGEPPDRSEVREALADADVVIVENLCSLPMNPAAGAAVASVLEDRRAILHHHDLPWQREALASLGGPPDAPGFVHVTVNERSALELASRGIPATFLYNCFDPDPIAGRRPETRRCLGVEDDSLLIVQPTRAIPRKDVPAAIGLAEALGAVYWLLGPAEDGYEAELAALLAAARVPVRQGRPPGLARFRIADAYAACDAVAFPSIWEGFGNPSIESAVHDRPLAIGHYPVAEELRRFGFEWFDAADPDALGTWLKDRDPALLVHNHEIARRHFSTASLPDHLESLLMRAITIP